MIANSVNDNPAPPNFSGTKAVHRPVSRARGPPFLQFRKHRDKSVLEKTLFERVDLLGEELADDLGDRNDTRRRGKIHTISSVESNTGVGIE